MQPAKPRINITPPTTRKSQTGSKPPRSVMDEMLESTPWRESESERERERQRYH
jgi:hypothetical protein